MKSSPAKQARDRRYYDAHRTDVLAHKAAYHRDHRDHKLAYNTAYYANVEKPRLEDRRSFLERAKAGVGCADCETDINLEFHHRDKATKKYTVSLMLRQPWCEIMDEIWKCDVLCKSCHTKRHNAEDRFLVN